jgi:hypothetical protein
MAGLHSCFHGYITSFWIGFSSSGFMHRYLFGRALYELQRDFDISGKSVGFDRKLPPLVKPLQIAYHFSIAKKRSCNKTTKSRNKKRKLATKPFEVATKEKNLQRTL